MIHIYSSIKTQIEMLSCSNLGDMHVSHEWVTETYKPHSGFRIPALLAKKYVDRNDRPLVAPPFNETIRITKMMEYIITQKEFFTDCYGRQLRCVSAVLTLCRLQDTHGNNHLMTYNQLMDLIS